MQSFLSKILLLLTLLVSASVLADTENTTIEKFTASFDEQQGFLLSITMRTKVSFIWKSPKTIDNLFFKPAFPGG